jgi:hypothetical protein
MSHLPRTVLLAVVYSLGLLLSPLQALATAILVVVKTDGIYVGADGLRDVGSKEWFAVCKAHPVYGGVLLKYGSSQDYEKTYFTDNDVKSSIDSNKTFADFQKSVLDRLMKDAEINRISLIKHFREDVPQVFVGDTAPLEVMKVISALTETGLVFISAVDGKLRIQELLVSAAPEPVDEANGIYRLVVTPATWHMRDIKEEVLAYPASTLPLGKPPLDPMTQAGLIADPYPYHNVRNVLQQFEIAKSCSIGDPLVVLRVTPMPLDPNKTQITYDGYDSACQPTGVDHWNAKPISKPDACHVPGASLLPPQ